MKNYALLFAVGLVLNGVVDATNFALNENGRFFLGKLISGLENSHGDQHSNYEKMGRYIVTQLPPTGFQTSLIEQLKALQCEPSSSTRGWTEGTASLVLNEFDRIFVLFQKKDTQYDNLAKEHNALVKRVNQHGFAGKKNIALEEENRALKKILSELALTLNNLTRQYPSHESSAPRYTNGWW
jgi:hypothetical protein